MLYNKKITYAWIIILLLNIVGIILLNNFNNKEVPNNTDLGIRDYEITITPTPTVTPTNIPTPTPIPTCTPTVTPTPTSTPTPISTSFTSLYDILDSIDTKYDYNDYSDDLGRYYSGYTSDGLSFPRYDKRQYKLYTIIDNTVIYHDGELTYEPICTVPINTWFYGYVSRVNDDVYIVDFGNGEYGHVSLYNCIISFGDTWLDFDEIQYNANTQISSVSEYYSKYYSGSFDPYFDASVNDSNNLYEFRDGQYLITISESIKNEIDEDRLIGRCILLKFENGDEIPCVLIGIREGDTSNTVEFFSDNNCNITLSRVTSMLIYNYKFMLES